MCRPVFNWRLSLKFVVRTPVTTIVRQIMNSKRKHSVCLETSAVNSQSSHIRVFRFKTLRSLDVFDLNVRIALKHCIHSVFLI